MPRQTPSSIAARRKPGAKPPRLARRAEAEQLEALVTSAFAPYRPRFGQTPPAMTADFDRLIAQRQVYVLEEDDGPAALMVARTHEGSLVVDLVAVPPERLRRGLGRALIAYAETLARIGGLRRVELPVEEEFWEAIARYQRLGYQEVDRLEQDGVTRVCFRKHLGWQK